MLMSLDKFLFVQEMQKNGFDVDFKQLQKIYTSSRKIMLKKLLNVNG